MTKRKSLYVSKLNQTASLTNLLAKNVEFVEVGD